MRIVLALSLLAGALLPGVPAQDTFPHNAVRARHERVLGWIEAGDRDDQACAEVLWLWDQGLVHDGGYMHLRRYELLAAVRPLVERHAPTRAGFDRRFDELWDLLADLDEPWWVWADWGALIRLLDRTPEATEWVGGLTAEDLAGHSTARERLLPFATERQRRELAPVVVPPLPKQVLDVLRGPRRGRSPEEDAELRSARRADVLLLHCAALAAGDPDLVAEVETAIACRADDGELLAEVVRQAVADGALAWRHVEWLTDARIAAAGESLGPAWGEAPARIDAAVEAGDVQPPWRGASDHTIRHRAREGRRGREVGERALVPDGLWVGARDGDGHLHGGRTHDVVAALLEQGRQGQVVADLAWMWSDDSHDFSSGSRAVSRILDEIADDAPLVLQRFEPLHDELTARIRGGVASLDGVAVWNDWVRLGEALDRCGEMLALLPDLVDARGRLPGEAGMVLDELFDLAVAGRAWSLAGGFHRDLVRSAESACELPRHTHRSIPPACIGMAGDTDERTLLRSLARKLGTYYAASLAAGRSEDASEIAALAVAESSHPMMRVVLVRPAAEAGLAGDEARRLLDEAAGMLADHDCSAEALLPCDHLSTLTEVMNLVDADDR